MSEQRAASSARARLLLGAGLVAALELGVVVQRSTAAERTLALVFGLFAELLGFCAALAALAAWLGAALARARAPQPSLGQRRPARRDWLTAALVVVPVAVGVGRLTLLLLVRRLHNQELFALLATPLLLSLGALSWRAMSALAAACELQRARRPRLVSGSTLSAALLTLLSLFVWFRSAGLEQLDRALVLAPLALLGAWALPHAALRVMARAAARPALWFGLGAGLALLGSLLAPQGCAVLAGRGAWSRPVIAGLRLATDLDGDGYSAWFAGGDCAPFDAAVHPGAREVPGDGVDNNCVAGDALPAAMPEAQPIRSSGAAAGKNLIIVSIETLRGDHTSLLGYARKTTPELEALAASSVVFETTYAPTPTTRLSLTALLSGVMPSKVRWLAQEPARQMRRIAPETPWLPELLARHGYDTLAVHTDFRAFTAVENAGFERGFARYDTTTRLRYSGGTMRGFPGEAQVNRALTLLDEGAAQPFFLWLHLVEPHYVYERSAAAPDFGGDERALYDADIAEADRQLGRLLRGLAGRGLLERSVLLVTGDHGEEFGEHGERWHGSNLYEPQLRTVSLLRVPGVAARRVRDAVSLVDFTPTLADLLGVAAGASAWMGRDLAPLLLGQGRGAPTTALYLENFRVDSGAQALYGVVEGAEKCLYDAERGRFELYDLRADPGERASRFLAGEPRSERCRERLYRFIESAPARGPAAR